MKNSTSRLRLLVRLPLRGLTYGVMAFCLGVASLGMTESSVSIAHGEKGTISHDNPDVRFIGAFTNDDGVVNDWSKDPGDDGTDPGLDKKVARCVAYVKDRQRVKVKIYNAYPGYTCQFWTKVKNTGNAKLKCEAPKIHASSDLVVSEVTHDRCDVLKPGKKEIESFTVTIRQSAGQSKTLYFTIEKKFVKIKH